MSDLAKKCAARLMNESLVDRVFDDHETGAKNKALAAFIERAEECRAGLICVVTGYDPAPRRGQTTGAACNCSVCKDAATYDAALRDLAQSMEVSDD